MTRLLPVRWGIDTNDYLTDLKLPPGTSFAGRYLRTDGWVDPRTGHSPLLLRSEALWCRDNHVDLLSFRENGKSEEVLGGMPTGVKAAEESAELQRERGGGGQPIFPTVDFTPKSEEEFQRVVGHWKGWRGVIGLSRLGVYGPYSVIARLATEGLISYAVQSILGDWSDKIHPRATSVQYLNIDDPTNDAPGFGAKGYVCYQYARAFDFGQWRMKPDGT